MEKKIGAGAPQGLRSRSSRCCSRRRRRRRRPSRTPPSSPRATRWAGERAGGRAPVILFVVWTLSLVFCWSPFLGDVQAGVPQHFSTLGWRGPRWRSWVAASVAGRRSGRVGGGEAGGGWVCLQPEQSSAAQRSAARCLFAWPALRLAPVSPPCAAGRRPCGACATAACGLWSAAASWGEPLS